jgi:hypothetical protein
VTCCCCNACSFCNCLRVSLLSIVIQGAAGERSRKIKRTSHVIYPRRLFRSSTSERLVVISSTILAARAVASPWSNSYSLRSNPSRTLVFWDSTLLIVSSSVFALSNSSKMLHRLQSPWAMRSNPPIDERVFSLYAASASDLKTLYASDVLVALRGISSPHGPFSSPTSGHTPSEIKLTSRESAEPYRSITRVAVCTPGSCLNRAFEHSSTITRETSYTLSISSE